MDPVPAAQPVVPTRMLPPPMVVPLHRRLAMLLPVVLSLSLPLVLAVLLAARGLGALGLPSPR